MSKLVAQKNGGVQSSKIGWSIAEQKQLIIGITKSKELMMKQPKWLK